MLVTGGNRVENLDEKGYLSMRNMLQNTVQDTVWAQRIPNLENPDGFLNLVTVC